MVKITLSGLKLPRNTFLITQNQYNISFKTFKNIFHTIEIDFNRLNTFFK